METKAASTHEPNVRDTERHVGITLLDLHWSKSVVGTDALDLGIAEKLQGDSRVVLVLLWRLEGLALGVLKGFDRLVRSLEVVDHG